MNKAYISDSINYINFIGTKMNADDLTDLLDGINSMDVTRHLSNIRQFCRELKEASYVELCDTLILLNTNIYNTRYRPEEWILTADLVKLQRGCLALTEGLKDN